VGPDSSAAVRAEAPDSGLQAAVAQVGASIGDLERLGLPLGWSKGAFPATLDAAKIFGLLLTALAVSLGAPFWFDVLNKIMSVRAAGRPPAPSPGAATPQP
jgi:hypothetical protein